MKVSVARGQTHVQDMGDIHSFPSTTFTSINVTLKKQLTIMSKIMSKYIYFFLFLIVIVVHSLHQSVA